MHSPFFAKERWYTYPSEKYESQLGRLFPIYEMENKIHVPNHQSESVWPIPSTVLHPFSTADHLWLFLTATASLMAGNQRKLQHHETAMSFPNALALLIPFLQHWSFWMACVRKIGWRETMGNYAGNPMSNCKNDNFLCPSIAPGKKKNLAPWMMLVYTVIYRQKYHVSICLG